MHRKLKFIEAKTLKEGNTSEVGTNYPVRIEPWLAKPAPLPCDGGLKLHHNFSRFSSITSSCSGIWRCRFRKLVETSIRCIEYRILHLDIMWNEVHMKIQRKAVSTANPIVFYVFVVNENMKWGISDSCNINPDEKIFLYSNA